MTLDELQEIAEMVRDAPFYNYVKPLVCGLGYTKGEIYVHLVETSPGIKEPELIVLADDEDVVFHTFVDIEIDPELHNVTKEFIDTMEDLYDE